MHFNPDSNMSLGEDDKKASVLRNYENCRTGTNIVIESEVKVSFGTLCITGTSLCLWLQTDT